MEILKETIIHTKDYNTFICKSSNWSEEIYYYLDPLDNDNKVLHNINDKPATIWYNGDSIYSKVWYKHGIIHREFGPAIDYIDGLKHYFYNGESIGISINGFTEQDFKNFIKFKAFK